MSTKDPPCGLGPGGEADQSGAGSPRPVSSSTEEVDRRRRVDVAVRAIVKGGSSGVGDSFFQTMVCELCRVLGAEYTLIGELLREGPPAVRSLALCRRGEILENITYQLEGTPCANVVGKRVRVYPEGVAGSFPSDKLLRELEVEGYIGIPLFDSRGRALGIAVALYREPIEDAEFAETVLLVFAERIASEVERLHLESDQRELEQQLLRTQKLESLGVLAGGIAHDFNNLLCGMLGCADLALLDLPQEHPARENVESILVTARQAADLCRQLLAYSGRAQFVVEPVDLSRLTREMAELLGVTVTNKARFDLELDEELPPIEADATQIKQVLVNLVANASESLDREGGRIRLSTRCGCFEQDDLKSAYLPETPPAGRYVVLEVEDTGCGMDESTLAALFDPFFSTKFTGRGLGLAATLGIVRGHRGSLKVESRQGRGSRFTLFFPAIDASPLPPREEQAASHLAHAGRVLVVDDEPLVRSVARRMLERMGLEVAEAGSGDAALDLVRPDPERFDLILLDMTMPGLSGEQTFLALRELRADLPVILSSGYNEKEALVRLAEQSPAGFLKKPYEMDRLRRLVSTGIAPTRSG